MCMASSLPQLFCVAAPAALKPCLTAGWSKDTCAHLVLLGLAATLLGRLHLLLILICSLVHLQAGMPSPGESVGGPGGPVQPVSRVVQPSSSSQLASREPRELTLPAVARRTGVASCILVSILTE